MKNKRTYIKPTGRLLILFMEDSLCNSSGIPGGEFDDDVLLEDWEDGDNGYGSGDL